MENKYSENRKRNIKKSKNKKNFFSKYKFDNIAIFVSVIIILAYFANNIITSINRQNIKTEIINFGNVETITEKDMVIVRNDKVMTSPSDAYYEIIYPEGERIKKGIAIAKTKTNGTFANYNYLIEILDTKIKNMNENNDSIVREEDVTKINNKLEQLYKTVQNRIQNDEIDYVDKLKKELISINDEKQYFFFNEQRLTKEELIAQKEKLISEKNSKNMIIYASQVGLISSYYDGLEEKFNIKNLKKLNVSDIKKVTEGSNIDYSQEIKKGKPVVVISENFRWYLICEILPNDIENIVSEKPIFIEIEDKRFRAYLEDFHKGADGKFLGYFRVEDEKFSFYEKRKVKAKIILQSSDGLAIPNSSIIEYEGKKGVFVVERTGVAHFREIKNISAVDENFTGIEYSPSIEKNKNEVKLYDEVIINPNGIKEGQRVR